MAAGRRVRHPLRPGRRREKPRRPGPRPPGHPPRRRRPVPQDQPRPGPPRRRPRRPHLAQTARRARPARRADPGPIRGPQPPVRNVSQRGLSSCFRTSACRYPRSHTSVGDVGMIAGHGGATCRGRRAADLDGRRGGSSSGRPDRGVSGVPASSAAVFAEHGPVVCDVSGPLVGVPDYGGGGLGRGEPAEVHQVPVAGRLYRLGGRGGPYVPGLAHLQRRREQPRPAVRLHRTAARPVPLLTPGQVEAIVDQCARWDAAAGQWSGPVRNRLLFATLAETGMRLGEVLSTRHRDWHAGRGGTPFIEVVPRQDHPAGMRSKSGRYRRIYISDDLERLHSEYIWQLCDADAHRAVDLENHFVFVNLHRGQWLAPLRSETVCDQVTAMKRKLGAAVPAGWTPHWFRHTHASALLLSGAREHVVMRRLGHADIQTTLTLYGWVTEDAELRALADWRSFCASWRGWEG